MTAGLARWVAMDGASPILECSGSRKALSRYSVVKESRGPSQTIQVRPMLTCAMRRRQPHRARLTRRGAVDSLFSLVAFRRFRRIDGVSSDVTTAGSTFAVRSAQARRYASRGVKSRMNCEPLAASAA